MTKKVLGNDPFASNNTDESESKPAAKPSAKPAAKASKRPTARPSKAPKESTAPRASKRPKKSEPDDDLIIPAVPKVPAEARHLSEPSHSGLERVEPQREAPASEASPSTSPSSAPVAHAETTSEIAADSASATSATGATSAEVTEADEERAAIDEAGAEAAVATDASARDEPSAAPVEQEPEGSIEERIRDLESQLDVLLDSAGRGSFASWAQCFEATVRASLEELRVSPLSELHERAEQRLRSLVERARYDGPAMLSHGDAQPMNVLVHNQHIVAWLDWEFASGSDPCYELAYVETVFERAYAPWADEAERGGWRAAFYRGYGGDPFASDPERLEAYALVHALRSTEFSSVMAPQLAPALREATVRGMRSRVLGLLGDE